MDEYKSLGKKKRSVFSVMLACLLVCELCCAVMLVYRLSGFSAGRSKNVFSLTESSPMTDVRVGYLSPDGTVVFPDQQLASVRPRMSMMIGGILPIDVSHNESIEGEVSGFFVSDADKVWQATTDVEIFKTSYENGEAKITVDGDGDKVIAPGTENSYSFTLQNSSDSALGYTLEMEAYFSNPDKPIPVTVRLQGSDGGYFLGGESTYVDVMQLNTVSYEHALGAGRYATYTLDWQWSFEGDDAYDTELGNLAVFEDQSLTIVIRTVATQYEDPEYSGGDLPITGDDFSFLWWLLAALLALFAIRYVILARKREEY